MDNDANGGESVDLLKKALSVAGLDLEGIQEFDEEEETPAQPVQVTLGQPISSASVPMHNYIKVGADGSGLPQIINTNTNQPRTSVPVHIISAQDSRSRIGALQGHRPQNSVVVMPNAGQIGNGQCVFVRPPGRGIALQQAANGSSTPGTKTTPNTLTVTCRRPPQNASGNVPRQGARIVVGPHAVTTTTGNSQMVLAVSPSLQQLQGARVVTQSQQQLHAAGLSSIPAGSKVVIRHCNKDVLLTQATTNVPGQMMQNKIINSGQKILQVASICPPQTAAHQGIRPVQKAVTIMRPAVQQAPITLVSGHSGLVPAPKVRPPGLSVTRVINAAVTTSPGLPANKLHYSNSMLSQSSGGSQSGSNSPVRIVGSSIPTKINVARNGDTTLDLMHKAFQSASQQQKKKLLSYPLNAELRNCYWPTIDKVGPKDQREPVIIVSKKKKREQSQVFVQQLRSVEEVTEEADEESEELNHAETYADYMPKKVQIGQRHPDQVVESNSLASVEPPDVTYKLSIPEQIIDEGRLSALQLEAITYACQRHEHMLANGHRAGYLIGDGAGVGKGRTIAGIIFELYQRGIKRAIWLSVSNDLKYDAERDLADIGASHIKVHCLTKFEYGQSIRSQIKRGVMFCTYPSLIGESSLKRDQFGKRVDMLFEYVKKEKFQGALIFDECHKAKNFCPSGTGKSSTKTASTVLKLQEMLPFARVVYASATGATEPKHMAYMTRLGLWGNGASSSSDGASSSSGQMQFNDFISSVEKRGMGAMEMVAMDMKQQGMYLARQLSFKGVTFKIEEVPLSKGFEKVYNDSVALWVKARNMFQKAADLIHADQNMRKTMWGQYWSAHQRFFKYLCLAAKVNYCVTIAHRAVEDGKCVVIGLQSTGEARTQEMVEEQGADLSGFVSTARGVIYTLVSKHFPAADRNKSLSLLGLGERLGQNSTASKRQTDDWQNRVEEIEEEEEEEEEEEFSDIDMSSDLEFLSSESDGDSNPFGCGSDDSDDDTPWVKKSKRKRKSKPRKPKKKRKITVKKKKPKKKLSSDDENDEYCDRILANLKKASSFASSGNSLTSDNDPDNQVGMERALDMKAELMNEIDSLGKRLPANTLDELIDRLGGTDVVAEMTGRKGRVVHNSDGIQYESRSESDATLDSLNMMEKKRFMDGLKNIAIITDAASSGISLHADRRAANKRRRVHITIELPWSADRAIQQFGRTHRSNQVNAPEYIFLISELAGERRFASTVAKRLESLGALTHGDRRATETRDLSQFNIDHHFGRQALETVLKSVTLQTEAIADIPAPYTKDEFFEESRSCLAGVGLVNIDNRNHPSVEKDISISKFLNRLLGMPVKMQNSFFDYFNNTLNAIIQSAKRSGHWDQGIMDLGSGQEEVQLLETKTFYNQSSGNTTWTKLTKIKVERGMSLEDAQKIWRDCRTTEEGFYVSTQERNMKRTAILVVRQGRSKKTFSIYRPNTGLQARPDTLEEIKKKYKKVLPGDAETWWQAQYITSADVCTHAYWNGNCKKASMSSKCGVGLRTREYHVLSGSVLPIWTLMENVLNIHANNQKTQIVRVRTGNDERIVGYLILANCVDPLVKVLTENSCKTITETPESSRVVPTFRSHNLSTSSSTSGLNGCRTDNRDSSIATGAASEEVSASAAPSTSESQEDVLYSMPMIVA